MVAGAAQKVGAGRIMSYSAVSVPAVASAKPTRGKAGGGVGHGLKTGHVGTGGGDDIELGQRQHGDVLLQDALDFLVDFKALGLVGLLTAWMSSSSTLLLS